MQQNRNVDSSPAPAGKSFSEKETPPPACKTAETPTPVEKDPGLLSRDYNEEVKNICEKRNEFEELPAKIQPNTECNSSQTAVSVDTIPEPRKDTPVTGSALPRFDVSKIIDNDENYDSPDSSDKDEDNDDINDEMGAEKSEAHVSQYGYIDVELPNVLVLDMKAHIKSMGPTKFSKTDNAATKFIAKFKKTLPCPKCQIIHGFTPQGLKNNQYGGTAPQTCRASAQQIVMALPNSLITDIANCHKLSGLKDAEAFNSWIASSKSEKKGTILKALKCQMDDQPTDLDDEAKNETNFEKNPAFTTDEAAKELANLNIYSDSEFRAAATEEILSMRKRIAQLEEENSHLRKENSVLRRFGAEPRTILPGTEKHASFAEVAKAAAPKLSILKRPREDTQVAKAPTSPAKPKPIVNLDIFIAEKGTNAGRTNFERSELCFVYFKGLLRRQQSQYRAMFDQIGFGHYKARDIQFLSRDLVQILTYENCVEELVEKVKTHFPSAAYIKDADPTDPKLYSEHGALSKDYLIAQYYVTMEQAVERFKKLVEKQPVLTRTLHFLEKVVETKNTKYARAPSRPKIFLMNSFIALDSIQACSSPAAAVESTDMDISPATDDSAIDCKAPTGNSQ